MTVRFLDLTTLHREIASELRAAFDVVLEDSQFVKGCHVAEFEQTFADYVGSSECVGVGNGTDALEIAVEAFGAPRSSEVIVPANSFIATSEAVTRSGYDVVFADVEPATYNLDPADVASRITERTVGVIAVHLYGNPAPLTELRELCDRHDLFLIEDAAQAHGATYRGSHVGTVGDAATFSFYPGKNLGALGDGGAIVTSQPELAQRCRMIADHGRVSKYNHEFEGRNSRLDGIQASFLIVKLRHLDRWVAHRQEVAAMYDEELASTDLRLPTAAPDSTHAYHLYVVRCDRRDELASWLSEHDIETGVHYPIALPAMAAYRRLGQPDHAMFAVRSTPHLLSLPIGPHLTAEHVQRVSAAVAEFEAR